MKKILILIFFFFYNLSASFKGLCVVPVADLLKKRALETFGPDISVVDGYKSLLMGDVNCKREYQLLYNELVDILKEDEYEVQIRVPHIIYYDSEKELYTNIYWSLKSNFLCVDYDCQSLIDFSKIPEPVSFNQEIKPDSGVVTLIEPFFEKNERAFSAGTRFKAVDSTLDNNFVGCHIFDDTFKENIIFVPRSKLYFYKDQTISERIKDYISLLRSWANLKSGFIPYLYSGSSYIYSYFQDDIFLRDSDKTYYKDEFQIYPFSGFDCSCIISRGAQICNLPYFYKDSTTLERNLADLNDISYLNEGDIIWFPGHVVIVSDLKNNLVLEARGYASGFGRVHECHISKMFEGVNSFKELFDFKNLRIPLKLLAKDGSLRYFVNNYKILSLKSGLYREFKSLCGPVDHLDISRCYKIID